MNNTKIINLKLDLNKRLIFISDIHGNLKLFKDLLNKLSFDENDYLFILGDIIEKSYDNLSILDYIMELNLKDNIFILCGNCDNVLSYMISNVDDGLLKYYAIKKKNTILLDFARGENITINNDSNMEELCEMFYLKYKKYYDFILNLPHIYNINNKIYAVHGGINDIDNISLNSLDVMKNDNFYLNTNSSKMIQIVGHFPVINYDSKIPSLNPIIDLSKKIISIDGGVSVVPWYQLNALIIDNLKNLNITYEYIDDFKLVKVKSSFNSSSINTNLLNITHKEVKVDIKDEDEDFYIAYYNNIKLYILKECLLKDNYVFNAFNYFHSLIKNELVSLIYKGKNLSIIKKDGIIGLCYSKYLGDYNEG